MKNSTKIKIRNYGTRAQKYESPDEKFEAQNTNKICKVFDEKGKNGGQYVIQ